MYIKNTFSQEKEHEFSFKSLFVPFTTLKAIHWIIFIGIVVLFNGLFNGFVEDDNYQIGINVSFQSIGNIFSIFRNSTFINVIPGQAIGVYYKPLLLGFFSIIYSLFGQNPFPFHFFQIAFYITNSCLLYFLFKHFFKRPLAFVLSLLFLIHPINSEVAFYISDTQEILFFFFGIIGLLLLIKFHSLKNNVVVSLCFFLSLLSKETGVLFVIVGIFYVIIFNRKHIFSFILALIPFIALYSFLRIQAIGIFTSPTNALIDKVDLFTRVLNIPWMFFFYIKTFLFPLSLASSYQWVYTQITFSTFFLPLIIICMLLAGLIFFAFILHKTHSKYLMIYLFFFIWFFLGICMHMQILPLDDTVAERWFYFPMVGLLGMIGVFFQQVNIKRKSKILLMVIATVIILLVLRTFVRSFDWKDNLTIYSHDVLFSNSYILYNGLSSELYTMGDFKNALKYAQISVDIYPYFTNYLNLGNAYLGLGEYQKAKEAYVKSLKYFDFYVTYENLALAGMLSKEDLQQNITFVRKALKKFPNDIKLLDSLAVFEYRQGNIQAAKKTISYAFHLDQGSETLYIYTKIMHNQQLNLNLSTK